MEEEIRKKTEEIEAFWTCSPDPIVFFNRKGEIERVNPAFETVFGYHEKDLNDTVQQFIPSERMEEGEEIRERSAGEKPLPCPK